MITSGEGMRNMKREIGSGVLLIAGSLAGVVVMLLHPTAHGLMDRQSGQHLSQLNTVVHGLALAAVPATFLGLVGLWRRLQASDLATTALTAYAWGCIAVMSAAVASGFVAPGVIARIIAAEGSKIPDAFLMYTGLWNQGFTKVYVVASSIGIVLFSAAILRTGRVARATGVVGALVGALILLVFFAGRLTLDVHGFGIVTFAQSAWLVWVGILLCREGGGASAA